MAKDITEKNYKGYEYDIIVQELHPPLLEKYHYFGIAKDIFKDTERIRFDLKEVYGETIEDTKKKTDQQVKNKIDEQA